MREAIVPLGPEKTVRRKKKGPPSIDTELQLRIGDALNNKKNMWKELRHLGLLPGMEDALHGFSPDELNAHFAEMFVSSLEDIEDAVCIFQEPGAGGFVFRPFGLGDVKLALKHFSSRACGEDGIPQSVISKALPFFGPHLVKHFVIYTIRFKTNIALLCFLSRVLEKLAHDQMTSYLEESGLLDLMQTSFRKYNSTETALIKLTDGIRMGIDKKRVTILLLFDFSKVFNTIPSFRLLVKLKSLGFLGGALRWIGFYLRNRTQYVFPGSTKSDYLTTNLGVPQGFLSRSTPVLSLWQCPETQTH